MERVVGSPSPFILANLFSDEALAAQRWEPFRPGVEVRWIYRTPHGTSSALLRYAPGATLERHVHPGYEHILVLSGSQTDDNGEHPAGTLIVHAPGSSHAISTTGGCIVLAVWEKAVHLTPAPAATGSATA